MFDLVFDSPYIQYAKHNGKKCGIIGELDKSTYDFEEVGIIYEVELEDGTRFEAWPEELFKDCICIVDNGKQNRGPYHGELFN